MDGEYEGYSNLSGASERTEPTDSQVQRARRRERARQNARRKFLYGKGTVSTEDAQLLLKDTPEREIEDMRIIRNCVVANRYRS